MTTTPRSVRQTRTPKFVKLHNGNMHKRTPESLCILPIDETGCAGRRSPIIVCLPYCDFSFIRRPYCEIDTFLAFVDHLMCTHLLINLIMVALTKKILVKFSDLIRLYLFICAFFLNHKAHLAARILNPFSVQIRQKLPDLSGYTHKNGYSFLYKPIILERFRKEKRKAVLK